MKPLIHRCKIGTHATACVVLRHNYKIEVGKVIWVREAKPGYKFFRVRITRIDHELGKDFFFADLH